MLKTVDEDQTVRWFLADRGVISWAGYHCAKICTGNKQSSQKLKSHIQTCK